MTISQNSALSNVSLSKIGDPLAKTKYDNYDVAIATTVIALGALAGLAVGGVLGLTPVGIFIASGAILGTIAAITIIAGRRLNLYPNEFTKLSAELQVVVDRTPQFNDYKISLPNTLAHLKNLVVTGLSIRPSNLFFDCMLSTLTPGKNVVTMPSPNSKLFAFTASHEEIAAHIRTKAAGDEIVKFSARGRKANAIVGQSNPHHVDLEDIFGTAEYQISYQEIKSTLDSQKIYVSALLPLEFYQGFKSAMLNDKVVELRFVRDKDGKLLRDRPSKLKDLMVSTPDTRKVSKFLLQVKNNPKQYGFKEVDDFEHLLNLTSYQIGAMVVKSENYYIFVDSNGKIIKREVGDKDSIRLLNACGIRPEPNALPVPDFKNRHIMKETFKTALAAAESGMVVFPAVGMGVWGGNPDIYWRAFLDAVIESPHCFEAIFVNPNHAPSTWPNFKGKTGDEFDTFLKKYIDRYAEFPKAEAEVIKRLKTIHNLREQKTDVVQLARELKKTFPEKNVSLFNASDPDVTLGNHVGEYVNNQPHTTTTEENYTAFGSNGICFETMTGVHDDLDRQFQVSKNGTAVSGTDLGLVLRPKSIFSRISNALAEIAHRL